ncbi:MAG: hypothetical protein RLZZ15_4568 [Verrucomicrobiota bacterium]
MKKNLRPRTAFARLLAVAFLLPCAAALAADVRVVGSDLLGAAFSKTLAGAAAESGTRLALALEGSRPGLDELKSARAHLAVVVLTAGDEKEFAEFRGVPLAFHGVVVLVPDAAPLEQIALDQLDGAFGVGGPLLITRWGDFGLKGEWAANVVSPQVPAVGTSLITEYFRHRVLKDRAFKSNLGRYGTPEELSIRLAGASRAIAIATAVPPTALRVKILPVAVRVGEPAFLPTPENLVSGDYPLRLPVRVLFRADAPPSVTALVRFLLGEETARALAAAELVPLPPAARRQLAAAIEKSP